MIENQVGNQVVVSNVTKDVLYQDNIPYQIAQRGVVKRNRFKMPAHHNV